MLNFTKLKFKDVVTSDFGDEEVTIRVNAESVRHYARRIALQKKMETLKVSEEDVTAYSVAVNLMALCTDPITGEYSFHEDQLSDFVDNVSSALFNSLSQANLEVNPEMFVEATGKTLTAKKKSS